MATEEELQAKSDKVALLRSQIAEATAKRVTSEREASSDYQLAQLSVEEKVLETRLAALTVDQVDATSPTLSAQEQMEAALRQEQLVAEAANSKAEATESASANAQQADLAEVETGVVTDITSTPPPPPAVPAVSESASITDSEKE